MQIKVILISIYNISPFTRISRLNLRFRVPRMLLIQFPLLRSCEPEYVRSYLAHLNLLGTFSDAVSSKVTINMLKGVMP